MCGIVGFFPGTNEQTAQALTCMKHRGKDAFTVTSLKDGCVGHVLHALIGTVPQPLHGTGVLLFNGEIYNWKQLAKEEEKTFANDAQLLLHLLDTYSSQEIRERLDGVYAYAYIRDNSITLERDRLGVKPLWYAHSDEEFAFASEGKALREAGCIPRELHPRTTLTYDAKKKQLSASVRPLTFPNSSDSLETLFQAAVNKRIPDTNKVGILFSGGVDSSLLALLAKQARADVTLYVAALDDDDKATPHDLLAARKVATQLDLPLVEVHATLEETQALIPTVCKAIETANVIKVGVALPLWLCCARAKKDGQRVMFSGLGAEEVFAGYARHKQALDINKECLRGLRAMHERDLYRDDIVGMASTLEIRLPFLDLALVGAGLAIPSEQKIVEDLGKMPLRLVAKQLGLSQESAMRPKKAAQYGSQFDAAIAKLARREGMSKSEYLKSIYPDHVPLVSLLSSGKDSVYALYTMQKMNYDVRCCATVISENPDSYMYHTPSIHVAKQQADSMGIPWISEKTAGVKEKELVALRAVLRRAIAEFGVRGVVSGALFSNYQRERIEQIAEELGLLVYAPLWHLDQEQEVREILDAGFTFVLSKVAAEGLNGSFVGRAITHADFDYFRDNLHLNVAGEGGEYESLVIDGPNFREPIDISSANVVCEKEGSVDVCELVFEEQ